MEVELDLKKSIEKNASDYFDKGKKLKSKIKGITETIELYKDKLKKVEKEQIKVEAEEELKERKQHWYEKFRWFITSEGFLAVGGRDAGSNDMIVKKHMDKNDLVFHTEATGSPFFILKIEKGTPTERSIQEVGDATYIFSKSFKAGMSGDAFYVKPDQVSKEAEHGEYLEKGSFMVRGKKTFVTPRFNLSIGIMKDGSIMCGPTSAVKKQCEKFLELKQSREKPSDVAKKIKKKLGGVLDDIIRALPAGNVGIKK